MTALRVGIFDSGVGGLSVLRALQVRLPGASLHYIADSAHAPYGERDDAFIVARSTRLARHLMDEGAQAIVVACNTATAIAVVPLRETFAGVPIVGVEPGVKPAAAASRCGRVGVMATGATLRSARFRDLVQAHAGAAQVHLQACTGLAAAIEAGDLAAPALRELVERHCAPLRAAGVDTVVLGCTHYPFVHALIAQALGEGVQIIDTAEAVARRAAVVCAGLSAANVANDHLAPASVSLHTTGDPAHLRYLAAHWLPFACDVSTAPADL
jgi:glutamate racemase